MEAGKGSLSAMGSGLQRAAHVREDPPPWVFEDALAGQLLDAAEAAELEAEMAAWPPVVRRALRVSHAVRVRLAEDVAAAGLAAGRRHYVLLGGGLAGLALAHAVRFRRLDHATPAPGPQAGLLASLPMPVPLPLR